MIDLTSWMDKYGGQIGDAPNRASWIAAREKIAADSRKSHAKKLAIGGFAMALARNAARARLARVECNLTLEEWERLLDSTGWACARCGSKRDIVFDHMVAVSRGGGHVIGNVCPLCAACNTRKATLTPLEWIWREAVAVTFRGAR
jgi:hypothetical protein